MTSAVGDRPAITARGLQKAYRGSVVLNGLDLQVNPGQVVALLGPNGAGKTTTVKILLGLTRPNQGTAEIFGVDVADPASRRAVGYLPERFAYPPWQTGRQVLALHARLAGVPGGDVGAAVEAVLAEVGLAGRGGDKVRGYSKGMQQRLGLAAAIVGDPGVVVLDEPTSALDPLGRREVRDLIRRLRSRGTAVLLNSHLLDEVEQVADDVVVMDRGQVLASGQLRDLASGAEVRIELEELSDRVLARIQGYGRVTARDGSTVLVALDEADSIPDLLAAVVSAGARVRALVPLARSLEEVFVDLVSGVEAPS